MSIEYITSDTHFNHSNIIKYCNRPFHDIYEMNQAIIDRWNSIVNDNDIVYHLGDFAFIRKDNLELSYAQQLRQQIREFVDRLNGKIILIKGNHDTLSNFQAEECGFFEYYQKPVYVGDYILTHVPQEDVPSDLINVHGHIHNTYLEQFQKPWYYNVSCDLHDFKPIRLDELQNMQIDDSKYIRK